MLFRVEKDLYLGEVYIFVAAKWKDYAINKGRTINWMIAINVWVQSIFISVVSVYATLSSKIARKIISGILL